jgi:hypothetical protein
MSLIEKKISGELANEISNNDVNNTGTSNIVIKDNKLNEGTLDMKSDIEANKDEKIWLSGIKLVLVMIGYVSLSSLLLFIRLPYIFDQNVYNTKFFF